MNEPALCQSALLLSRERRELRGAPAGAETAESLVCNRTSRCNGDNRAWSYECLQQRQCRSRRGLVGPLVEPIDQEQKTIVVERLSGEAQKIVRCSDLVQPCANRFRK